MQRHRNRRTWFLIFLAIAWAGAIFFFSGQSGQESARLSGSLTDWLLNWLPKGIVSEGQLEHILRKLAHGGIFAVEGFLLMLAIGGQTSLHRSFVISLVISALMAGANELHQLLSEGRSCQFTDVLIDTTGALVGICVAAAILHLFRARRHTRTRRNRTYRNRQNYDR